MNGQPNDELCDRNYHGVNHTFRPAGEGYQYLQPQDGVSPGEKTSYNPNIFRRHKHHRKRHILPGPAGLLPNKGVQEDEGKDLPQNITTSHAYSTSYSWTQPQKGCTENNIQPRNPSHNVIIAPAWRAMCAALDRWIPPTGFNGSRLNSADNGLSLRQQIKRRLPPNFVLLSDIVSSSSRRRKAFFVCVMIASVQCHLHCDWTCELVDDDDEGRLVLGWLEDAFVRKVTPEVITRPGIVLLLRNVVMTAFCTSKEDYTSTEDQEPEPMFLIGENSVISMWLPSEQHDTPNTSTRENEQTDMDMIVEPSTDTLSLKINSSQLENDTKKPQSQSNTLALSTLPENSTTTHHSTNLISSALKCETSKHREENDDDNFEDFEDMNDVFFTLESGAASDPPENDRKFNSIHNSMNNISSQYDEQRKRTRESTHHDDGMLPKDVTNDTMLLDNNDLFHQTDFLHDLSD
jgi:hypothetical protein